MKESKRLCAVLLAVVLTPGLISVTQMLKVEARWWAIGAVQGSLCLQ